MALKFVSLTRNNQRKLEAGQKISEHGITYARLPNGDGRYSVNGMVDGKRIHRVIGKESDGVTREQVEQFLEQIKTEARQERLNLPKNRKIALTFKDAAVDYLTKQEQEGGKDLVAKQQKLAQHLVPFFGNMPLAKINSFDVERYKKKRLEEVSLHGGDTIGNNGRRGALVTPVRPGTVNRELGVLSHVFSKAVDWGWIDSKPASVKLLKVENARITYLTTEQIQRLLETSSRDFNPYIHLFILIGLETSMRKMEILRIRIQDIDLNRRVIFIPKAKAGAREQPITPYLSAYLLEHLKQVTDDQIWLFPSETSASGHMVSIEKAFRRVVTEAGLDPKEVLRHTLRHTAITHLVQAGVDLPTVQRISGHKTMQMVVRYSHQNGDHIREAMEKLEDRYRKKEV
ncbi:MAG: site-specific integrase [Methylomonas sp.]|nr:site-specific integrase [Methylomonas sp.]